MPIPDGTPVWVDFGSDDIPAAAQFFGDLLGWTAETPPHMGGYTLLRRDGAAVAGIGPRQTPMATANVSLSLAAADVDAAAQRAVAAGASLTAGPMTVPGTGRFAVLGLPGQQHVVLWHSLGRDGFEARDEVGAPAWFELVTPAVAETEEILAAAFGCDFADAPDGARVALVDGRDAFVLTAPGACLAPGWAMHVQVTDRDAVVARCVGLGGRHLEGLDGERDGVRYAALKTPGGAPFWVLERD